MSINQGDIFWAEPVSKATKTGEQYGPRPYIVMSRQSINAISPTAVVVPTTSKTGKQNQYFRIIIPQTEMVKEIGCQRVLVDSVALCDMVRVVDQSILIEKVGKLTHTAVLAVQLGLSFLFNLP